jgi:hypothetical protein
MFLQVPIVTITQKSHTYKYCSIYCDDEKSTRSYSGHRCDRFCQNYVDEKTYDITRIDISDCIDEYNAIRSDQNELIEFINSFFEVVSTSERETSDCCLYLTTKIITYVDDDRLDEIVQVDDD